MIKCFVKTNLLLQAKIPIDIVFAHVYDYIFNLDKIFFKTYCESIGGGLANVYTRADHDMILSVLGQSLSV